MNALERKQRIEDSLAEFGRRPLAEAAIALFESLGYESDRRFNLKPNTAKNFVATFAGPRQINTDQALVADWQSVSFLFQLTDSEVRSSGQGLLDFDSAGKYDGAIIESYLFLAVDLKQPRYTRTELSTITRAVNRLFDMPVMMLFRHGEALTLSVIRRRLHKRDESRDVLEKVTLVKDISYSDPIRAHIEILYDLSFQTLYDESYFQNFVGLHKAWEKRLDSYALNERFYREVANWYFWALNHNGVVYPRDVQDEEQRSIFLIRLLTRLIFCWFLQEKALIPRDIFRRRYVEQTLQEFSPRSGTFYRAFLQNLFFATLNQEPDARGFRKKYEGSRSRAGNRGVTNLFRYADLLKEPDAFVQKLCQLPFINGGLFDCLDVVYDQGTPNVRLDDFSEERKNELCLPNELFFSEERVVDLSDVYEDNRRRRERVRGLIDILSRYKFTIEENTPLEEEIALDPELLGRVFENLLASYNEDTRTTARKATGSFYTPRQIVGYLVDESLIAYFEATLKETASRDSDFAPGLRELCSSDPSHSENPFNQTESAALIAAINRVKILDPACGSGAFLMGALHRLVGILQKLDKNNEQWRELQRHRAINETEEAFRIGDNEERKHRLDDINEVFERNTSDYGRKLYLIENCIYGVDIQPIACQIAKLRFFIALIVDQKVDRNEPNFGVRPLPNLEAKIVAADTLVPIEQPAQHQYELLHAEVRPLREQLQQVRHEYFSARTPAKKRKCREQDTELRRQIAELLRHGGGFRAATARAMAEWDPYDQNAHANFFDPEWMFGLPLGKVQINEHTPATLRGHFALINEAGGQMELQESNEIESGFDVVIGNPPYIRIQTLKQKDPKLVEYFKEHYASARKGNYDIYVVFVERGLQLLKSNGNLAYILPHKFFNAQYGEPLRALVAQGRYLRHVVHFGDQQVFPGATNYVCLLFLNKSGADYLRIVKVSDLEHWLKTTESPEAQIPAQRVTSSDWNFAVGANKGIFENLNQIRPKLGELAGRISQGLRTSANEVYVLDALEQNGDLVKAYSKQLDRDVVLERMAVSLFLQGKEIKPFSIRPSGKVIIIPYTLENTQAHLVTEREYKSRFPRTFEYLQSNKTVLQARESGRMRGDGWYAYIYPKNLEVMSLPKLLVPDIADRASFALDESGDYAFISGYGITLRPKTRESLKFILGLANSRVLDYYWRQISTPLRGGFYRYFTQFIEQLPIPSATPSQQMAICSLVDYLLWLNRKLRDEREHSSPIASMVGYFEQTINGLAYELFFQEELHGARLRPFKLIEEAHVPRLDNIPENRRLATLQEIFDRLYDTNHPLRGCLHDLGSLATVRTIEGRD